MEKAKQKKEGLDMAVDLLVAIGAINWGLFGAAKMDLVQLLLGSVPVLAQVVYVLVGLAGLYFAYKQLA